jgi:glycosyltransferase involved in cell wall biosynthesis
MRVAVVGFCFNCPTGRRNLRVFEILSKEYKVKVDILTVDRWGNFNDALLEKEVGNKNLKIHRLRTLIDGYQHRYFMIGLYSKIKELKPDVVYAEEEPVTMTAYTAMLAAKSLGVPFIFFSWENIYTDWFFPVGNMERNCLRNAATIIAGSQEARKVLLRKGADKKKMVVFPQTGVDVNEFRPLKSRLRIGFDKGKTVLFVGRFLSEKGIDEILKAKDILDKRKKRYKFLFVGGGELSKRMKSIRDRNVKIMDWLPANKLPDIYNAASLFLYPSTVVKGLIKKWSEQFGYSLVESLLCEVPVIASDVGGPREIVKNNKSGFLIKPGDFTNLADKIEHLMEKENLRKRFGKFGRRGMVKKFSNQVIAGKLHQVFQKAVRV